MIWGGARAKAGKKTQRLLAQEKKKLNSTTRKKVQRLVGEEKKSSMASCRGKKNSTRILCPRPPQIINGPSLTQKLNLTAVWSRFLDPAKNITENNVLMEL